MFLDVSGAFDNVNLDILLRKLAEIGCPANTVKFVKFLTTESTIYSEHSVSAARLVHKGVPQGGGVLSPLLFSIYVANITENVPKSVCVSQFADDIALWCNRTSNKSAKNLVQKAVNIICNNLYSLGLEVNPNKTVFLQFSKSSTEQDSNEIVIKDVTVKNSSTARFLGILFDTKLSFKSQIESVQKKCLRALNIIKYSRGTWWGIKPEILIMMYTSFVRSLIDYGILAYYPTQKYQIKKLEVLQNTAIRLCLGYRNTTPTNILLAESKLTTIQDRSLFLCKCYLHKVFSNNNLIVSSTINRLKNRINNTPAYVNSNRLIILGIRSVLNYTDLIYTACNYPLYTSHFETFTLNHDINTKIFRTQDDGPKLNSALQDLVTRENAVDLYTDGSKSPESNSVGCALYLSDSKPFSHIQP